MVINVRTKLHENEEHGLITERKKHIHRTQLKTLHDDTRGI
jgi:hypothetical protein